MLPLFRQLGILAFGRVQPTATRITRSLIGGAIVGVLALTAYVALLLALGFYLSSEFGAIYAALIVAGVISSLAGVTEVVSALILGWVIDAALASGPDRFFADHGLLIATFVIFYMVLRPLAFGVSSASIPTNWP